MSSEQQNNVLPVDLEQQDEQQDQQPENKKTEKQNKDWHQQSHAILRSQVDLITHSLTMNFNQDKPNNDFTIDALRPIPVGVLVNELVTTGSADLQETFESASEFFQQFQSILQGTAYYGVYVDSAMGTSCEFSVFAYRNDAATEIVFSCDRVQGCGMAFARFYKEFNTAISNDKSKPIWTFEAPTLSEFPLSPTPLLQHSSMNDNCPFDHATFPGATPVQWATSTITDIYTSAVHPEHKHSCDSQFPAVPLSASAQAHMFTQCFDSLLTTLAQNPVLKELESSRPAEFAGLSSFLNTLLTKQVESTDFREAYPMLAFLLSFPILSVRISTLQLLVTVATAFPQYVFTVVNDDMLSAFDDMNAQESSNEDCSPFDYLHHQTIREYTQQLSTGYASFSSQE